MIHNTAGRTSDEQYKWFAEESIWPKYIQRSPYYEIVYDTDDGSVEYQVNRYGQWTVNPDKEIQITPTKKRNRTIDKDLQVGDTDAIDAFIQKFSHAEDR